MYQGVNKKACASQRQIADALLALMSERSFAELTVSEICQKAGVSRQTFYSLFRSKENVVCYLLRQDCCEAPGSECSKTDALLNLCASYSGYVMRQRALLRLLADHHIMQLLHGILLETFSDCACFGSFVREELRPYAADYVASALTSIAETFVRGGTEDEKLEQIAYSLLKGEFFLD